MDYYYTEERPVPLDRQELYLMLRAMRPEDRRFVVPTWVRSLAASRRGEQRRRTLRVYWGVVDRVLDAPGTRVVVMASDGAARTLHAWACATGDVLHYAYVPPELRHEGLARQAITAVLGSYPEHVATSHAWPFESARFRRQDHHLLRQAA